METTFELCNPAQNIAPGRWFTIQRGNDSSAMLLIQGPLPDRPSAVRQFEDQLQRVKLAGVIVNSTGGNAVTAHMIARVIRANARDVLILNAHSGAFLIAMAGRQRAIARGGTLMIHPLSPVNSPAFENVTQHFEQCLREWTGTEASIVSGWLRSGEDRWFTADEAKAASLVHSIVDAQFAP